MFCVYVPPLNAIPEQVRSLSLIEDPAFSARPMKSCPTRIWRWSQWLCNSEINPVAGRRQMLWHWHMSSG